MITRPGKQDLLDRVSHEGWPEAFLYGQIVLSDFDLSLADKNNLRRMLAHLNAAEDIWQEFTYGE